MWQNPSLRRPLAVGLGAILGATLRYLFTLLFSLPNFPIATFLVNLSGCFLMGFAVVFFLNEAVRIHPDLYLLLTTGFLGSYTTFSSYELDTYLLLGGHHTLQAVIYWSFSVIFGILAYQLGERTAQRFLPPGPEL